MSELKVNFNFTPEVMEDIAEAEVEVERILGEIKDELLVPQDLSSEMVDLPVAAGNIYKGGEMK